MLNKRLYFPLAALIIAALACNLPESTQQASGPNAAFTAAAQTVAAQLTGAAQIQGSTPTPTLSLPASGATLTPTPQVITGLAPSATATVKPTNTQICDQGQFITDVSVPDGTIFDPDTTFTKTWRLKNIGTCSWTPAYTLAFSSGDSMSGPSSIALSRNVNQGDTIDVSVNLKAPTAAGDYTGNWKLHNASGASFLNVTVVIHVGSSGGAFAVIHVYLTTTTWGDAGHVGCPQVNAAIVTNGPGSVTYHWVRSDASSATSTLTFAAAGSQTVQYKWALGSAATPGNWVGVYIDEPNHQEFPHTDVTPCTTP